MAFHFISLCTTLYSLVLALYLRHSQHGEGAKEVEGDGNGREQLEALVSHQFALLRDRPAQAPLHRHLPLAVPGISLLNCRGGQEGVVEDFIQLGL